MMCRTNPKWFGVLLIIYSTQNFALSIEDDAGPMPPPEGPFFSSKPLLYFNEEPSVAKIERMPIQRAPTYPPARAGYPMQWGYPGYYGSRPPPLGGGRNMMQQQIPNYQSGWGAPPPYNRYNPNYSGSPQFPGRWGRNSR